MSARLHVLGAGAILPRRDYGCAGYALRATEGGPLTLFDCGPGSVRALGRDGLALTDVRGVILSHFHLDHCLDVFALAFARHNPRFTPAPALELVGPEGFHGWLARAPQALGHWARDPRASAHEVALDAAGRGAHRLGAELPAAELELACVRTGHTPEALAWRATLADGTSLAYTGDTGPSPAVARLARDVDLFVVECSFPDGAGVPNHLTPLGAGRMAAEAGARRLLLTHFYPELDPEHAGEGAARAYDGPIELARDGSVHAVGPP